MTAGNGGVSDSRRRAELAVPILSIRRNSADLLSLYRTTPSLNVARAEPALESIREAEVYAVAALPDAPGSQPRRLPSRCGTLL